MEEMPDFNVDIANSLFDDSDSNTYIGRSNIFPRDAGSGESDGGDLSSIDVVEVYFTR